MSNKFNLLFLATVASVFFFGLLLAATKPVATTPALDPGPVPLTRKDLLRGGPVGEGPKLVELSCLPVRRDDGVLIAFHVTGKFLVMDPQPSGIGQQTVRSVEFDLTRDRFQTITVNGKSYNYGEIYDVNTALVLHEFAKAHPGRRSLREQNKK